MDRDEFLEHMIEAFEGNVTELTPDVEFQKLPQWDSLVSVGTVAMIFVEYDVQISGDDLVSCETLADLMALVDKKRALAA